MKKCTRKLTYLSCSFFLIHTKETRKIKNILEKIKTNVLFSMWKKKKEIYSIYM